MSSNSYLFLGNSSERKDQLVTQWLRPFDINMTDDKQLKWAVFRNPLPTDISQGENLFLFYFHTLNENLVIEEA